VIPFVFALGGRHHHAGATELSWWMVPVFGAALLLVFSPVILGGLADWWKQRQWDAWRLR
jgi:hypothetical protein